MAEQEFFSFEEALKQLRLKEEELKRLVSEGEIRAFRQGDTMKLRRRDVEHLRNELTGAVVDLGGASDEVVFEDDLDLGAGMATEEISDVDTIIEDDIEDVGELEPEPERAGRRAPRVAAIAPVEEETEPGWVMLGLIASAVVLLLAMPICLGVSRGQASDFAKAIGGIFAEFK